MLSRIKLTYPDIRVALMEILDEKLSIENLKAIKQYVPSGDEVKSQDHLVSLLRSILEKQQSDRAHFFLSVDRAHPRIRW